MPRANRHYLPGYVWHITHRCHKKEFLLKFARDQRCWLRWLYEAKKRFGVCILNYAVTSNHVHLIVQDTNNNKGAVIPHTMQLAAGRTGQAYNQRKKRKGAFWEDRYNATAVERDTHLSQCMIYVDLNMVRAGVVSHPMEWSFCGYNEIQNPRQRYSIIDYERLKDVLGFPSLTELQKTYREWVKDAIERLSLRERQPKWSESIAVGHEAFVRDVKEKLGIKAVGREVIEANGACELREPITPCERDFGLGNETLRQDNTFYWEALS